MSTMTRNVQPGLIALGLVLLVVGSVALLLIGWQTVTAGSAMFGAAVPAQESVREAPSPLWAVVAGLLLACGGAAIGIGLNRWFGYRK